jgi:hypothetical protein
MEAWGGPAMSDCRGVGSSALIVACLRRAPVTAGKSIERAGRLGEIPRPGIGCRPVAGRTVVTGCTPIPPGPGDRTPLGDPTHRVHRLMPPDVAVRCTLLGSRVPGASRASPRGWECRHAIQSPSARQVRLVDPRLVWGRLPGSRPPSGPRRPGLRATHPCRQCHAADSGFPTCVATSVRTST